MECWFKRSAYSIENKYLIFDVRLFCFQHELVQKKMQNSKKKKKKNRQLICKHDNRNLENEKKKKKL